MKFLVDQQLPPDLATWLVRKGVEARHVRDIGLRDAEDDEIWNRAMREDFVIVTKDEDFAERRARADGPVVVWLRIGNATNRRLFAWLEPRWTNLTECLDAGASVLEVR